MFDRVLRTKMDVKTKIRSAGISSLLSGSEFIYVVSTIHRSELGGFYQTSILKHSLAGWKAGPNSLKSWKPQMVYRIETLSQWQSVEEHIDAVNMALSKNEEEWLGTKHYQDGVMNALTSLNHKNHCPQEMSWTDKKIRRIVSIADINYKPGFFRRLF